MAVLWIGYLENEPVESRTVGFDTELSDGRFCAVGCLVCRNERAVLMKARPVRPYVEALDCKECGTTLVAFESDRVMRFDEKEKRWKAA